MHLVVSHGNILVPWQFNIIAKLCQLANIPCVAAAFKGISNSYFGEKWISSSEKDGLRPCWKGSLFWNIFINGFIHDCMSKHEKDVMQSQYFASKLTFNHRLLRVYHIIKCLVCGLWYLDNGIWTNYYSIKTIPLSTDHLFFAWFHVQCFYFLTFLKQFFHMTV